MLGTQCADSAQTVRRSANLRAMRAPGTECPAPRSSNPGRECGGRAIFTEASETRCYPGALTLHQGGTYTRLVNRSPARPSYEARTARDATGGRSFLFPHLCYLDEVFKPRFAICVDGGFVQKVLWARNQRIPTAADILGECERISQHEAFANCDLLRIYYYDAPPSQAQLVNPIDGSLLDLQATETYQSSVRLQAELKSAPNVALRMGDVLSSGWRVSENAIGKISREPRPLEATDLKPNLHQKGVDIRIGLDIARLALKDTVRSLAVVTADTDFVPAFKFARREGIRVYLDTLGKPCRPELIEHSDLRLSPIPTPDERKRERQKRSRQRQKARKEAAAAIEAGDAAPDPRPAIRPGVVPVAND